jgi:histidinol-phosphate/aromatic aminotransferase/cobyric acid decarboxylase-like protein
VPFGPDFRYDIERCIATVNDVEAKALVLNTPNNPTGSVLRSADDVLALERPMGLVSVTKPMSSSAGRR